MPRILHKKMDNFFLVVFLSSLRFCDLKSLQPTTKVTPRPSLNVRVTPTANIPSVASPTVKTGSSITSSLSAQEQERLIDQIFPSDCGVEKSHLIPPQYGRRRRKRVVGGQPVAKGQVPWQVALLFRGKHYCGGSIIHENYIVTGAHCFNPFTSSKASDWLVRAGDHRLGDRDMFEVTLDVENITIHQRYKSMWFEGITDTPPKNDIAIVKLKHPLRFNTSHHIKPICLLRPNITFQWGDKCMVSGWGHLQWNGSQPNTMNYAHVPLVSHKDCNIEKAYNGTIHETAMCAGYPQGGTDACEYDSGGPLSCTKCNRAYLAGIVSWGHQCARPYKYGVYARMHVLTSWLVENVAKLEAASRITTNNSMKFRNG